jgi:hypothetical protein
LAGHAARRRGMINFMRCRRAPAAWLSTALVAGLVALAVPTEAHARSGNKPKRKGGQAEVLAGASACIPGKGECKDETLGGTSPSVGMALDVGWRANKAFFIGAGYGIGWFNPTWETPAGREFRSAYNQGVFGILRAYIPIWRIDFGFELAPGWSRQTFVTKGAGTRNYSQGFALRPGLSLDIWVGRHVFVGAKLDFIFNFHNETCAKSKIARDCSIGDNFRQTRVHQLIGGVHVGGTF